ncbi:MAG: imidazolonepropionase, partial [Actinomycetota bacterium]|nr:imidazolonepropionase [Actinomycetota bacterium]
MTLSVASDHVITLAGAAPGRRVADLEVDARAATIECVGDRIETVRDDIEGEPMIDARGYTVVPGFVDCHTHLPFYGWRADEDRARLSGERYEDIHGRSGGIFRSARMLAEA